MFFFNPDQQRLRAKIREALEQFGMPRIVSYRRSLRITLANCPDAQTLFALQEDFVRPVLVGCVVYLRGKPDQLDVAHIVVAQDYAMAAGLACVPLAAQLLAQVFQIAKQIRGIKGVTLSYCGRAAVLPLCPNSLTVMPFFGDR